MREMWEWCWKIEGALAYCTFARIQTAHLAPQTHSSIYTQTHVQTYTHNVSNSLLVQVHSIALHAGNVGIMLNNWRCTSCLYVYMCVYIMLHRYRCAYMLHIYTINCCTSVHVAALQTLLSVQVHNTLCIQLRYMQEMWEYCTNNWDWVNGFQRIFVPVYY
jgi:hypothetical protein